MCKCSWEDCRSNKQITQNKKKWGQIQDTADLLLVPNDKSFPKKRVLRQRPERVQSEVGKKRERPGGVECGGDKKRARSGGVVELKTVSKGFGGVAEPEDPVRGSGSVAQPEGKDDGFGGVADPESNPTQEVYSRRMSSNGVVEFRTRLAPPQGPFPEYVHKKSNISSGYGSSTDKKGSSGSSVDDGVWRAVYVDESWRTRERARISNANHARGVEAKEAEASGPQGSSGRVKEPRSIFNAFGHGGGSVELGRTKPLDLELMARKKAVLRPYVIKQSRLRSRFAVNTIRRNKGVAHSRSEGKAVSFDVGTRFIEARPRGSVARAIQSRKDYLRERTISFLNEREKRKVLKFELENNLRRHELLTRQRKATRKKLRQAARASALVVVTVAEEGGGVAGIEIVGAATAAPSEFMSEAEVL